MDLPRSVEEIENQMRDFTLIVQAHLEKLDSNHDLLDEIIHDLNTLPDPYAPEVIAVEGELLDLVSECENLSISLVELLREREVLFENAAFIPDPRGVNFSVRVKMVTPRTIRRQLNFALRSVRAANMELDRIDKRLPDLITQAYKIRGRTYELRNAIPRPDEE